MRKLVVVLYSLLLISSSLSSVVVADDELQYNLVSLQASSELDVDNDQMQVLLAVEHEARLARDAADQVNKDMQWALDLAKASKMANKKMRISTKNYATNPRYDKRNIIGWQAQQQLYLEGEDFAAVSELATKLQSRFQIKTMSFAPRLETRKAAEEQLIERSLKAFSVRADLITKTMSFSTYEIVDIHIGTQGHRPPVPRQRMTMMTAESQVQDIAVSSGTSKLVVTTSGRIQLR